MFTILGIILTLLLILALMGVEWAGNIFFVAAVWLAILVVPLSVAIYLGASTLVLGTIVAVVTAFVIYIGVEGL